MCCSAEHVGPPPEWYRELADEPIPAPRVSPAEGLAYLAAIIHDKHQRGSGPGRRAVSTEKGQGRALPTWRRHGGVPVREDDQLDQLGADWHDTEWTTRPRQGLRPNPGRI
jgi:hypothetical protein